MSDPKTCRTPLMLLLSVHPCLRQNQARKPLQDSSLSVSCRPASADQVVWHTELCSCVEHLKQSKKSYFIQIQFKAGELSISKISYNKTQFIFFLAKLSLFITKATTKRFNLITVVVGVASTGE